MGDVSGCQPSRNNLAVYLQGVTVTPSSTITSEYFVTASLPSSASLRRVWQFTTQGNISGTSTLTLDYTEANKNCPEYNITFEDALNGTLIIHNQTFSANKYVSYALSTTNPYVLVLTITIPKKIIECYGVGSTQPYFLNVNINDAATTTTCSFTTAGTYTASFSNTSSSVQTVDYICVGGGGGGQDGNGGNPCLSGDAAGGGGGTVETGTFSINANSTVLCSITVGSGGSHGKAGGAGGGSTSLDTSGAVMDISIDVSGGCGGASGVGGDSGVAKGGTNKNCGSVCAGGGGAGGGINSGGNGKCSTSGGQESSNGGNGGDGYTWEINGITYGGGGGGAGEIISLGGKGGGGSSSGGNTAGGNGSTGGGGGAGATNNDLVDKDGGDGGDGVVLFSWTSSNITATGCPS